MEHIVRAISPEQNVAEMLAIPPGEPCLKLSRRTWVNGVVVTFANFTYPSSRYDLSSRYNTDKMPQDSAN
jgi:GntR family histidine utilization transcriptional repressor